MSLIQFSRALGRDDKLISIDAATPWCVASVETLQDLASRMEWPKD